jgi:histone H4
MSAGLGQAGKVAAKRKKGRATQRPTIEGITKGDIRRMARRGGCKRISSEVFDYTRDCIKGFAARLVKDSLVYTAAAKRVTVAPMDVVMAVKRMGKCLYGWV